MHMTFGASKWVGYRWGEGGSLARHFNTKIWHHKCPSFQGR